MDKYSKLGITFPLLLSALARVQGEFKVTERYLTMSQLCSALKQQRVKELFGSGTSWIICPIGRIVYQGEVRESSRPILYGSVHQYKPKTIRLNDIKLHMEMYVHLKITHGF